MSEVFTFDESGMKKVAEAVTRLHVQTEHIRGQVGLISRNQSGVPSTSMKPQVRTGITGSTPDEQNYPENKDSCLFPFHVYDLEFDHTAIDVDCAPTDNRQWPGVYHIGRTIDGSFIPPGTPIVFVEIPTPTGKQFWILHVGEPAAQPAGRWFVMREDLQPYEKNKKAAFAAYFPVTDRWEDDSQDITGTQELHDDGGQACALRDELVFAFPRPYDSANNPTGNQWDLVYNHGLQRRGKVSGGDVLCGATGLLEIWRDETLIACEGDKLETPEVLIPFCNKGLGWQRRLYGPQTAASPAKQDELWIGFDGYHWHAVRDTRGSIAHAEALASFCQESSVGVSNIRYRDWQHDCSGEDANIGQVDNSPHRLAGDGGDGLVLLWNEEVAPDKNTVWTVAQVEHKSIDPVTAIVDDGQDYCPQLAYERTRVVTMTSDACPTPDKKPFLNFEAQEVTVQVRYQPEQCSFYETQAVICVPAGTTEIFAEFQLNVGEAVTVMVALDKFDVGGPDQTTDCGLQASTLTICSLNSPGVPTQPTPIGFTEEDVIEDVHDESDGLHQDKASHWVLCSNPPVDELILEYTDCVDEGGNEDIDP